MEINARGFVRSALLLLPAIVLILPPLSASAQTISNHQEQKEVATVSSPASKAAPANVPVFKDYRGISIGMSADDVRAKLDRVKKGDTQDLFVFSEHESAQIYYDDKHKVTAISVDYFGDNSNAPAPETVVGVALQAKGDGSMYQLNRYPDAGYWVSYNRTAGDKPIVTITLQKM